MSPTDVPRSSWTNAKTLGAAGILAGVLGVAWNLLSIAGVSFAYYEYLDRAQDRAAVEQAARVDRDVAVTSPARLIDVPAVRVPGVVTAGVWLCVVIFTLNTALAFVLIAASGTLPRRPARAWPLLRLYAKAKAPAAVLAGVAWWWLLRLAFDETAAWHVALAVAVVALGGATPMLFAARAARTVEGGKHDPGL